MSKTTEPTPQEPLGDSEGTATSAVVGLKSIEYLRSVFDYNKDTGDIFWKIKSGHARPGDKAGFVSSGYIQIGHFDKFYLAHRLAWAITYGIWPNQIDHINMDRGDNRLSNLREASISENNRNRKKQSNNTSGFKGVTWNKAANKFQAKITTNKKTKSLGYFRSAEEASLAYMAAVKGEHNEFARF